MFIGIVCIIQTAFWSYFVWDLISKPDFSLNNKDYRDSIIIALSIITFCIIVIIRKIVKLKKELREKEQYQAQHSIVENMTGIEYERYCGNKIKTLEGVKKIEYTPPSNDYGADIIAYYNDGTKAVIQCKRYTGKVNNSAVQEVVAALAHYNANEAILMTNSTLTENARILAKENGVIIIERFK